MDGIHPCGGRGTYATPPPISIVSNITVIALGAIATAVTAVLLGDFAFSVMVGGALTVFALAIINGSTYTPSYRPTYNMYTPPNCVYPGYSHCSTGIGEGIGGFSTGSPSRRTAGIPNHFPDAGFSGRGASPGRRGASTYAPHVSPGGSYGGVPPARPDDRGMPPGLRAR